MTRAAAIREKHDGAFADRSSVRLWLRLLSCSLVIEKRVKRRLADQFGATLPRFDVLAALDRNPGGMTLGALSRALLVSNGNVTGLVQKLQRDGHVQVAPSEADRRASIVKLTQAGRIYFDELAAAHHDWIDAMFAGIGRDERVALYDLLGTLKLSIADDNPEETRA